MNKERLRSPVVWTSIVSVLVPLIAMRSGALSENFQTIAVAIISIMGIIGILNNPTDKENF